MIVGQDLSEFQGNIDWKTYKDNTNFVLIKASEGVGYIDKWFGNNRLLARKENLPCGFYHFARPDLGNTAADEAKFFIDLLEGDSLKEGEILALDFEVDYKDGPGWCKAFLDIVSEHFNGIKPLIYLNQSQIKSYDWTPVINGNYGLWIAAYTGDPNNNNFDTGAFPGAAIQQWVNNQTVPGIPVKVDGDVFFGDTEAFKKYGYMPPAPQPTPDPCADVKYELQKLQKDYKDLEQENEKELSDANLKYNQLQQEFVDYKKTHLDYIPSNPNPEALRIQPSSNTLPLQPNLPIGRSAFEQIVDSFVHWWEGKK